LGGCILFLKEGLMHLVFISICVVQMNRVNHPLKKVLDRHWQIDDRKPPLCDKSILPADIGDIPFGL
jgi:hypothetical protein